MCNSAGIDFVKRFLGDDVVRTKRVLEIGSKTWDLDEGTRLLTSAESNSPGQSVRAVVVAGAPSQYVGVDLEAGPGVDDICSVEHLTDRFGEGSFDIVVATELMEHLRDWRRGINEMKRVLRPGGLLLITTRSLGFPFHRAPFDYWRYEPDDMRQIFADSDILALERDFESPGVFILARVNRPHAELANIQLYSILAQKRVRAATRVDELRFRLARPRLIGSLLLPEAVKARLRHLLSPSR